MIAGGDPFSEVLVVLDAEELHVDVVVLQGESIHCDGDGPKGCVGDREER